MHIAVLKAVVASIPACLLLLGSAAMFFRAKTLILLVQLVGASAIMVVVLTHLCEALHLLPVMHWGLEHSVGHYLDLACAVLGFTLFPVGYFLHAIMANDGR